MADAENSNPVTQSQSTQTETQSTQTATKSGGGAGYDTNTTISSMAELKEKAPEVWNAMLQGLAQNICSKMKSQQDHIKQIMREARRDSGQY